MARISSREITEWQAYYQLEPFGAYRDGLEAGKIAATIANVNRKKGAKALKASDFDMKFRPARRYKPRAVDNSDKVIAVFRKLEQKLRH